MNEKLKRKEAPDALKAAERAARKAHRRKVHRANQLWKLCKAAEYTLARLGCRTTVADILEEAKMSRRSYYEFFKSLDGMIETMYLASLHAAMSDYSYDIPNAPWMILATDPTGAASVSRLGSVSPLEAFTRAQRVVLNYRGLGRDGYLAANGEPLIIEWYTVMEGLRAP